MKMRRLAANELWIKTKMLRIPWTKYLTTDEIFRKISTKRSLTRNRKSQLKFWEPIMGKEGFENLILTVYTEDKKDKQKSYRFKKLWRAIIGHVLE